jgi:hypothetical protein
MQPIECVCEEGLCDYDTCPNPEYCEYYEDEEDF